MIFSFRPLISGSCFSFPSVILFVFFCLLHSTPCLAATPQEEYKKIQKEIKTHKEKLDKVEKKESSILSEIEKTNRELDQVESDIRKYRRKLAETQSETARVEADINHHRKTIELKKEWIKRKLRALQRYGFSGDVVVLLSSADDISKLTRTWKSLQFITAYEYSVMNRFKDNLKSLNEKEKKLTRLGAEIVKNEEKIRDREAALSGKKKDREVLLSSVRKEKDSYEKMINELSSASKRMLEIIRESEKSDSYTSSKGFSTAKGRLPWPVEGKIAIPYGTQKDPQFNTPVFRSGIYIQSQADSIVKAVNSGKVAFAEWFKGYGQLVILNHGDGYHSLYGSLSEIFSKVGDIIQKGQTIGHVGNSGIHNAPGLYFELRYKGKPLDPAQWLKRR